MPSLVRRKLVVACVVVLALAFAGAALAGNGGIAPQPPRSPNAERERQAYWVILGITGGIFVLVEGALLVFVARFRNRGRPRELEGPQIRGHTRLELIWTVIPVLILAGIASFVFYKLPGIKNVPSARAGDPLEVKIVGHQFYWEFVYPNGVVQVNRLRAPAGRVVTLSITAPDVDHSWWIPSLGGKFDAIPGKTNHTWFRVTRLGVYKGQCGEFCGIQHQAMRAVVEVLPAAQFDRWLAAEARAQQAGTSDLGRMTFSGVCATCHGFQGQGYIGPAIAGSALLTDRRGLTTLLRQGRGKMPAVGATWGSRQLDATLAYLRKRFGGK